MGQQLGAVLLISVPTGTALLSKVWTWKNMMVVAGACPSAVVILVGHSDPGSDSLWIQIASGN